MGRSIERMTPLTCPPPPSPDDRDCPLYDARLAAVGEDAALRRLVIAERRSYGDDLGDLIRAEAAVVPLGQSFLPALQVPQLPAPQPPVGLPIDNAKQKEFSNEERRGSTR